MRCSPAGSALRRTGHALPCPLNCPARPPCPARRETFLRRVFNFDINIAFHKIMGYVLFGGGWFHAIFWMINYTRLVGFVCLFFCVQSKSPFLDCLQRC